MGISKVDYFGDTLIDLTGDTVSADNLLVGATAHDASGDLIQGEVEVLMELLNNPTVTLTSSNKTINLLKPLSDYKFIALFLYHTTSYQYDGHFTTTTTRPLLQLITPEYFRKNGSVLGYGTSGNNGSMNQRTYTFTYKDDVSLYAKMDTTVTDRYLYVYGIKI